MEDYDINELINLAKTKPSTLEEKLEAIKEPSEAHKFVLAKNIRSGEDKVASRQIYFSYTQWSNEPVSPISFGKQFSKLFRRYRDAAGSFYKLDASFLEEGTGTSNVKDSGEEAKDDEKKSD